MTNEPSMDSTSNIIVDPQQTVADSVWLEPRTILHNYLLFLQKVKNENRQEELSKDMSLRILFKMEGPPQE